VVVGTKFALVVFGDFGATPSIAGNKICERLCHMPFKYLPKLSFLVIDIDDSVGSMPCFQQVCWVGGIRRYYHRPALYPLQIHRILVSSDGPGPDDEAGWPLNTFAECMYAGRPIGEYEILIDIFPEQGPAYYGCEHVEESFSPSWSSTLFWHPVP